MYKLRLQYNTKITYHIYTSQDDKITSDALSRCQENQKNPGPFAIPVRLGFARLDQVGKCSQSSCCRFNAAVAATLAVRALPAAAASRQPRVPPGAPPERQRGS